MKLQEITIKRYFDQYPNHSLREVSENTGIQITRVFRIINGSQMKLSEFEKFEKVLSLNSLEFLEASKDCLKYLSKNKISELLSEMSQAIKMQQFKQQSINLMNENQLA